MLLYDIEVYESHNRVSLDCGMEILSRSLVWREGPSTHGSANYYVKFTCSDLNLACTLVYDQYSTMYVLPLP